MYVLLEFWQKNHGDPYYEPTIVVHDNNNKESPEALLHLGKKISRVRPVLAWFYQKLQHYTATQL